MRLSSLILFATAILCAGCAKPEAQLVGKWQMDTASATAGNDQSNAMAASLAKAFVLEFKSDKTFTGPMMEGTYTMNGHTVTMTTTKMMGMDVSKMGDQAAANNKPEEATLSDDGKSLTMTSQGKPMKFVRSTGT